MTLSFISNMNLKHEVKHNQLETTSPKNGNFHRFFLCLILPQTLEIQTEPYDYMHGQKNISDAEILPPRSSGLEVITTALEYSTRWLVSSKCLSSDVASRSRDEYTANKSSKKKITHCDHFSKKISPYLTISQKKINLLCLF